MLIVLALAGCSQEARRLVPGPPQTAPNGNADPRIPAYQENLYQISQGGRYFAWYGCSACHGEDAAGPANLADGDWRHGGGFANVFAVIGERHAGQDYAARTPVEQRWQLTAYVRDLSRHHAEKRRRIMLDQKAEPQGSAWLGPQ
jgi:cytochrome c oxidase cbb3-type subunit III